MDARNEGIDKIGNNARIDTFDGQVQNFTKLSFHLRYLIYITILPYER